MTINSSIPVPVTTRVWTTLLPIMAVVLVAFLIIGLALPQSRGLVMGIYTAFLDVALGLGSPALGLMAGWAGLSSVFLASPAIVL